VEGQPPAGPVSGAASQDDEPEALGEEDRRIVREARQELMEAPAPPDRRSIGCLAGVAGGVALFAWPAIARALPALDVISPVVIVAAGVGVLLGMGALLLVGGRERGAGAAVESALRHLEGDDPDREGRLRAATLLVFHGHTRQGPGVRRTVPKDEIEARLGGSRSLVRAVEEMMVHDFDDLPILFLGSEDG